MAVTLKSNLGNVAGGGVVRSFKTEGVVLDVVTITLGAATDYVTSTGVVLTSALLLQIGMRALFLVVPVSVRATAGTIRQFSLLWDWPGKAIRIKKTGDTEVTSSDLVDGDIIEALFVGV